MKKTSQSNKKITKITHGYNISIDKKNNSKNLIYFFIQEKEFLNGMGKVLKKYGKFLMKKKELML